jgi:hypothetical protein
VASFHHLCDRTDRRKGFGNRDRKDYNIRDYVEEAVDLVLKSILKASSRSYLIEDMICQVSA